MYAGPTLREKQCKISWVFSGRFDGKWDIRNRGDELDSLTAVARQGFRKGGSSSRALSLFLGVMSMASGSCRPFLKLRTLSPIPRLISGIFLPPKKKKTIPRMMISSQNPKPIKIAPFLFGEILPCPRRKQPFIKSYHTFIRPSHKISAPSVPGRAGTADSDGRKGSNRIR
jgi:hypothetical protein